MSERLRAVSVRPKISQVVGFIGTLACVAIFVHEPSFPTPDKLLVLLTFVCMSFGQALAMLKRLAPFVGLLFVYESFRGIAHHLNAHVNYTPMIQADEWLFGTLPTVSLQHWLWHGNVQWYDFVLYIVYMLHFVVPLALAVLIWKKRDTFYWQFMSSYVVLSFAGFLTYLVFPAAPPWMASDQGLITPIIRISSQVWHALGVQDFPSLYNQLSPNPVAAVPSLHAAFATLFALYIFSLFGKKWGSLALLYPSLLYFGIVYQGEHYVIDVLLGILYAGAAFLVTNWFFARKRLQGSTAFVSDAAK